MLQYSCYCTVIVTIQLAKTFICHYWSVHQYCWTKSKANESILDLPTSGVGVTVSSGTIRKNHDRFPVLMLLSSHERRITMMQFVITGQFLLCYTLPSVLDIMDTVQIMTANQHPWYQPYMVDLSNMLVIANSALRIFVYYAFGGPFKRRLCSLFCTLFWSDCLCVILSNC